MPAFTRFLAPDENPGLGKVYTPVELAQLPPPTYLLDGWIQEGTVGWVAGMPGSGKSLLILDWTLVISQGWDWLGHNSKKRNVLYMTNEGVRGIPGRLDAWCRTRHTSLDVFRDTFFIGTDPVVLAGEDDKKYEVARRQVEQEIESREIGVLVIDPLANYMSGSSNEEQNAASLTNWCRDLTASGLTVILGHHTAKVSGKGAYVLRGSGVFGGAADWLYLAEKKEGSEFGYVEITDNKTKDGESQVSAQFDLVRVETPLAIKRDDQAVGTSVVLKYRGVDVRAEHRKEQIFQFIAAGDGVSGRSINLAIPGDDKSKAVHVKELESEGRIKNVSRTKNPKWVVVGEEPESL